MRIVIEDEIVYITTSSGDDLSFHISFVNEISNALMIVRQLKEYDPLKVVRIEYGGKTKPLEFPKKGDI